MTRRLQHLSAIFRDGAHRLSDQSPRARVRETYAKLLQRPVRYRTYGSDGRRFL